MVSSYGGRPNAVSFHTHWQQHESLTLSPTQLRKTTNSIRLAMNIKVQFFVLSTCLTPPGVKRNGRSLQNLPSVHVRKPKNNRRIFSWCFTLKPFANLLGHPCFIFTSSGWNYQKRLYSARHVIHVKKILKLRVFKSLFFFSGIKPYRLKWSFFRHLLLVFNDRFLLLLLLFRCFWCISLHHNSNRNVHHRYGL